MLARLSTALALLVLCRCGTDSESSAHSHSHDHTPHDGVVARVNDPDGKAAGYVELKLHDDKGDLECWLAKDEGIHQAMALPLDQIVEVHFPELDKTVSLAVRNTEQNEDEDGEATIVDGKTHYFIYPTQDDQDASWLQGAEFSSPCVVKFELGGKSYASEQFTLVPHTHHEHDH